MPPCLVQTVSLEKKHGMEQAERCVRRESSQTKLAYPVTAVREGGCQPEAAPAPPRRATRAAALGRSAPRTACPGCRPGPRPGRRSDGPAAPCSPAETPAAGPLAPPRVPDHQAAPAAPAQNTSECLKTVGKVCQQRASLPGRCERGVRVSPGSAREMQKLFRVYGHGPRPTR